jgi:diguanylate cyclase (GGDEF)-like protein/PAS domain S-box-containing protein
MVVASLLLHLTLTAHFGLVLPTFILFYPAVISAALLFGLWSGLLAAGLAAVLAYIWIFPPVGHARVDKPSDLIVLALFLFIGAFISVMAERLRRNVRRVAALEKEQALRASEARYRIAFQTSIDAIAISRFSDGSYLDVNPSFHSIMGYESREVLGKTALELDVWADPRERERLCKILRVQSNCQDFQAQFRSKGGKLFWGTVSASLTELDGDTCILSVMRDITQSKLAEEEIRNLAFFDPLTGLANRRLLLEQLRKSMVFSARTHRKRALFFVDLDDFKQLNDTLGHQTGDLLLREVAQRLTACVRDMDTVGRLGGDEFVLLIEDLSGPAEAAAAQAEAIAEKILLKIAEPYELDGRECVSSCSIGITIFGDEHENISQVLQQADIAMYQAKAAGRNTVRFFAPALQTAVNSRAALEEDLRQGIKAKQFLLFYQPQVENGRLIGVEALLRWDHPRLGLLPPNDFIPMAEETRLILPLGKWVLESACKRIAAWGDNEQTASIAVAVNISAVQFRKPDFVEGVMQMIDRTGANPRNLRLELTESILLDNIEDVIVKMAALKALGLKFSLDDFGTGYSSLTYLKRLPLDQVKIDRSFISDILGDASSAAIAHSIISLSRAMGLPVIAEGVETEEQRVILADLGCHSFQGFLCSRPLPVDEFERLLPGFAANSTLA